MIHSGSGSLNATLRGRQVLLLQLLAPSGEANFFSAPMSSENDSRDHANLVTVPETELTTSLKTLQGLFPNLDPAIIDRAIITTGGDLNAAIEKLLIVSSKFT
jgi:hypothetical protein